MQAPGFWDDQETAAKTSAQHARATEALQASARSSADIGDLDDLLEMAADDAEIAAELDAQLASVERRLAELEEARLFNGEYDAGDAVVTVRSGAGGTDSQDWAEMLLRMYLRWAERRGFEVEMGEASEGEEAGLKSATFIAKGENAYGLFGAERGVHRLVRISPFDSQSRRHTAFAQVTWGRWSPTRSRSRSTRRTCGSIPTAPRARAASTSTRPIRPCASPTCRPGSSSSARTSARSSRTRRPRCASSARSSRGGGAKARGDAGGRARRAEGSRVGLADPLYTLHPTQRVKDHRTGFEMGDAGRVLDGDIDGFVREYLNYAA